MSASDWKGYFFKATATNQIFPNEYINWASYSSSPNHREEIKAYRDENTRDLTRITAAGRKTSIQFTTRPKLHLADKIAIQTFFTSAESDADQRKINLQFWNDEENIYKTGDFYRPNLDFKIRMITDDDIIYESLTIDLVEY